MDCFWGIFRWCPLFLSFVFWFYARHLRANPATLIFCGADIVEEKILFADKSMRENSILAGRQGQERPRRQKKPTRADTHALLCVFAGAVVGWQSEFRVGSPSAFVWIEAREHKFRASDVPAPCFFHALFLVCA